MTLTIVIIVVVALVLLLVGFAVWRSKRRAGGVVATSRGSSRIGGRRR